MASCRRSPTGHPATEAQEYTLRVHPEGPSLRSGGRDVVPPLLVVTFVNPKARSAAGLALRLARRAGRATRDVLQRVRRRTVVADRDHRLAAVAAGGDENERRVTGLRDGGDVAAVGPVA